jgi:pyruvate carboxylase subunit B
MTPISYYAACQAGVDVLDTAISPLSWGTSQPPTESMVAALQGTDFDTGLDLKLLTHIKKYFDDIKEKYAGILDPISESIDAEVLLYQIPGGMLSNLISQLKEQNALDRYNDVLEEMPRVRKDMGYPPLVTPTSQIVGIQSVMNVLGGERYKTVSNEVKEYMKGMYGKPPAPVDEKISKRIIGDEEVITCRPADLLEPEFDKFKKEFPTELPEQEKYDKLKEEIFRIDSLLRVHKIFQVLGTPIETIKSYFKDKSILESWDMFCQLCNEYNGIIIDIYSFNVTINCFIT